MWSWTEASWRKRSADKSCVPAHRPVPITAKRSGAFQSRFIAKTGDCLQEADETAYWPELISAAAVSNADEGAQHFPFLHFPFSIFPFLPRCHGDIDGDFTGQRAGEDAGLEFERAAITDFVIEQRMGDQGVHPLFIHLEKPFATG
jgi:hypothetical protein